MLKTRKYRYIFLEPYIATDENGEPKAVTFFVPSMIVNQTQYAKETSGKLKYTQLEYYQYQSDSYKHRKYDEWKSVFEKDKISPNTITGFENLTPNYTIESLSYWSSLIKAAPGFISNTVNDTNLVVPNFVIAIYTDPKDNVKMRQYFIRKDRTIDRKTINKNWSWPAGSTIQTFNPADNKFIIRRLLRNAAYVPELAKRAYNKSTSYDSSKDVILDTQDNSNLGSDLGQSSNPESDLGQSSNPESDLGQSSNPELATTNYVHGQPSAVPVAIPVSTQNDDGYPSAPSELLLKGKNGGKKRRSRKTQKKKKN